MAQLAREKLLNARLANFPITDSIDALTLGSVNFLPKRIGEMVTGFAPATETECQQILPRLQQILTSRVSMSDLPVQFSDIVISKCRWSADEQCIVRVLESGLVIITVDGEFQVKLGITDDKASTPWRLYKIELFVRDPEEPGREFFDPLKHRFSIFS